MRDIWPDDICFDTIRSPITFAGEHEGLTWTGELSRIKSEIAERDFDIAFVAAGGYGMPISSFVKDLGKKAVHFGGALQLLFGILGRRWERSDQYKSVFGEG